MKSFKRIVCFGVIISQVFGVAGSSAFGCNCKDEKGCKDYCYYDAYSSNDCGRRSSSGRKGSRQQRSYSEQEETKNLNITYKDINTMPWKIRLSLLFGGAAVVGTITYYIVTMPDGETKKLWKDGMSIGAKFVGNLLGGMSDGRRYYW